MQESRIPFFIIIVTSYKPSVHRFWLMKLFARPYPVRNVHKKSVAHFAFIGIFEVLDYLILPNYNAKAHAKGGSVAALHFGSII